MDRGKGGDIFGEGVVGREVGFVTDFGAEAAARDAFWEGPEVVGGGHCVRLRRIGRCDDVRSKGFVRKRVQLGFSLFSCQREH
jgi:hypothetical protein